MLGDFAKAEVPELDKMLDTVTDHMGMICNNEDVAFMNQYALDMRPQRPKNPKPAQDKSSADLKKKKDQHLETDDNPFAVLKKLKD